MTSSARGAFDAQDVTLAIAVAIFAQVGFIALFSLPSPKLVEAEISNDNARPIAVSITPVLKLGSKNPSKLPSPWQRKPPRGAKTETALPSPQAEKTLEAIPKPSAPDASVGPVSKDAGKPDPPSLNATAEAGTVVTASATEGAEQGSVNGTETDPLKARATDMYRAQLAAWFMSKFEIRGKIPFDTLKKLRATSAVTVTPDRRLGTFSRVSPSGDSTFDGEVQATLLRVQSSGVELPAPPPMYPDMLGKSFRIGFQCTIQRACE